MAHQMHDAGLNQGIREGGGDRVGEAFESINNGNQNVLRAAVLELVGVSRILCSGRSLSDGLKAFFEQNGELIFRLDPFSRGPFPILRRICQHEI